jgi:ribosome-associated protein
MNNTETPGDDHEPNSESTSESNHESAEPKASPSLDRFIRVTPPAAEGQADSDRSIPRASEVKDYSLTLAKAAAQVAIDNNGTEVLILDVCDQTALFDYFVLATGTSRRQLHAISEEIDDKLQKELGDHRMGIEGYEDSRWIVLDYGSVVIHLFDEETRSYYDLESLWADATVVPLADLR